MNELQIKDLENLKDIDYQKLYKLHLLLPKNDQMSYKNFINEFNSQNREYFFAIIENSIVGYIGIMDAIDAYEIIGIVVDENYQNMGIGKKLLDCTKIFAQKNKRSLIALEVDEKNDKAIKFYKNFGFQVTNIRKKYYRDNDAYVMHYYLWILHTKKQTFISWCLVMHKN